MEIEIVNTPDDPRPRCGDMWIFSHTNQKVFGPEEEPRAVLRHYRCNGVEHAIRSWGRLNNDSTAMKCAVEIVEQVEKAVDSKVFEIYFLDSGQYLTIVMASDQSHGTAFINAGFIDHHVELDGSVQTDKPGLWRTYLPTAHNVGGASKGGPVATVVCPTCFLSTPIYGDCACGWSPRESTENYGV